MPSEPVARPRIAAVWLRLLAALGSYVLVTAVLGAFFLAIVYIFRYAAREGADFAAIPMPTPKDVETLMAVPGVRLVGMFFQATAGIVLTVAFAMLLDRRPLASLGLRRSALRGGALVWGTFLGVVLAAVVVLMICALGGRHVRWEGFAGLPGVWVIPAAGVICLAAFAEEWLVRGYVFANFRENGSAARSILYSAALFTFFHMENPGSGFLGWMNLFLIGIVLGQLRELTGGIEVPAGLHIGWNLTVGMVLGADLSGISFPSLFRVSLRDLAFPLGGGAFGPEASVLATGLFVVLAVLLARRLLTPAAEV